MFATGITPTTPESTFQFPPDRENVCDFHYVWRASKFGLRSFSSLLIGKMFATLNQTLVALVWLIFQFPPDRENVCDVADTDAAAT